MTTKMSWIYVLLFLVLVMGCSDSDDSQAGPVVAEGPEGDNPAVAEKPKGDDPAVAEKPKGDDPVVVEEPEVDDPIVEEPGIDMDPHPEFDPIQVVLPFPPIVNAPIIDGANVVDQVVDKELVLGVVVNGEARAYPINMLTGPSREIINDTLGNRSIAATW